MESRKKNDLLRRIASIVMVAFIAIAYIPTFAFAAAEEAPKTQGTSSKESTTIIVDGDDTSDPDELLMQYMHNEVKGQEGSAGGLKAQSAGYDSLGEKEAAIYDVLINEIRSVADGNRDNALLNVPISTIIGDDLTITAEKLGLSNLVDDEGDLTKEAEDAVDEFIEFDADALIHALLADCPYELYWYDKTEGCSLEYEEWRYTCTNTEYMFMRDINIHIGFTVYDDYRPARAKYDTDVDMKKTRSAKTAADNARRIIVQYTSKSDYRKLVEYKREICELTSYNDAAADPSYKGYGDPWQMIWVFDGDEETTVVCEGYAKAFQFLCDETEFKNKEIECISATGLMTVISDEEEPGEEHMWNIVHMNDGKNYIADITNCDGDGGEDDAIGYPDKLFLTGAVAGGSVSEGYGYDCDEDSLADLVYTYDDTSKELFGSKKLTMSGSPFHPKHSLEKVEAREATCTETGNTEYWECSICEELFSDAAGQTETNLEAVTLAATGHAWGEWIEKSAATVFAGGTKVQYCSRCHAANYAPTAAATPYISWASKVSKVPRKSKVAFSVNLANGDYVKKWKSSKKKIASVSANGVVKGKKNGKTKITAYTASGLKISCTVKVVKPVKKKAKKASAKGGKVYWTPYGEVYHYNKDCPTLARSRTIYSGTKSQSHKNRACKVCG